MKIEVWTWGTGGPFGRELGLLPNRRRRGHTATSIIVSDEDDDGIGAHVLVDAGAPFVETMIEKGIFAPHLLFLTHPHFDHVSDLDRLANSRMRGLMVQRGVRDFEEAERIFGPLPVIGTDGCLNHPEDGVKARFGYLEQLVSYKPITTFGVWHRVRRKGGSIFLGEPSKGEREEREDGLVAGDETSNAPLDEAFEGRRIDRSQDLAGPDGFYPLEFQALPVRHSKHAPGSCLFIFRFRFVGVGGPSGEGEKEGHRFRNVVVSGDFKSMEDWVEDSPDLLDPACIILDSNTIKASGRYHASLEENKARIDRWSSGDEEVLVLINHLSGFGDYAEGFYDHVPDDEDWRAAVEGFVPKPKVKIKIAEDGACYRI